MSKQSEEKWMREALKEARAAAEEEQVPVGCVIVVGQNELARAHNTRASSKDPTAHAEMLALRRAAEKRGDWRLTDTTVYCTLEPCCMCAGALLNARVSRLVYGLSDPKSGACGSVVNLLNISAFNHQVEIEGGVLADETRELMQSFFRQKR
ncbi:MAG: tRNA adenosine(34) deaminase TadA [Candidatus Brocadiia bacterium]